MRSTALLTVLLCLACSKSEAPPSAATEAQPEPASQTEQASVPPPIEPGTAAAPPLASPSVELMTAGQAPRRTLRWGFEKGLKQVFQIRRDLRTKWSERDSPTLAKPSTSPEVVYELTVETTEVTEDGVARVEFEVSNAELGKLPADSSPEQWESLKASLGRVKGQGGSYSVDSRGIVSSVRLGPDVTDEALQLMLLSLFDWATVPVPEEEVGQGAKWVVKRTVQEREIRSDEVATVELKRLEGSRMEIDLKIERTAFPQEVDWPNEEMALLELKYLGTGGGHWDLTKLVPASFKTTTAKEWWLQSRKGVQSDLRADIVETMTSK